MTPRRRSDYVSVSLDGRPERPGHMRKLIAFANQIPVYTPAEPPPPKARPRRTTNAVPPTNPAHTSAPRRPTAAPKPPRVATAEDARRAGIPAGFSCKNWDPDEEPILLLGSVFDANSLGKWIYDWTVCRHGPSSPISSIAGELWLLLIQLADNIQRAESRLSRVRRQDSRDLIVQFLDSGERLWQRFSKLLKTCEQYMWRAAVPTSRRSSESNATSGARVAMGRNSGCEFVDSFFGRDRELERTEKLMASMRLWSMRFDANCEEILQNPSA